MSEESDEHGTSYLDVSVAEHEGRTLVQMETEDYIIMLTPDQARDVAFKLSLHALKIEGAGG